MPENLWKRFRNWGKQEEPSNFGIDRRKKYERRTDEAFLSSLDPQVRALYEQGELDYADPNFLQDCLPLIDRVPGDSAAVDPLDQTQPPVGLMRDADVESGFGVRWLIAKSPLGAGGMNEVFQGWDVNTARDVAIKKMKASMNYNARAMALYRDATAIEAKTMARLRHPNMPRIDHMMLEPDGTLLYMMELFNPEKYQLSTEVRGSITANQLATFVAELCDYEDYCHKYNLYHRDLKLGNVFIDRVTGSPRVFDMGISNWSLEPALGAGTPMGMSPERWNSSEKPDELFESEIFSIGSMLYHLITGEKKYVVPSGLPFDEARDKMRQMIEDHPQLDPAQEQLVKEKCKAMNIDGDGVVRVLNTCLAKKPKDRYHSGQDLAREFLSAYPRQK